MKEKRLDFHEVLFAKTESLASVLQGSQPMQLSVVDPGKLLCESTAQLAERRLLYALSRFDSRIRTVELVARDENGPRGGLDKVCRVSVKLHGVPLIVVTDRDSHWEACLSRVAQRVGRTVARTIEHSREFSRVRYETRGAPLVS